MKEGHEEISAPLVEHLDRCLGCMACVTACPSGVQYDKLIEDARPQIERNFERPPLERAHRRLIFELFTRPGRLRALAPGGRARAEARSPPARAPPARAAARAAARRDDRDDPGGVAASARSRGCPSASRRAARSAATVALLQGCVQRVFFGHVNEATARVLAAEGFEVHVPRAAALLRGAAAARRRGPGGAGARQGDDRGARALRHRRS